MRAARALPGPATPRGADPNSFEAIFTRYGSFVAAIGVRILGTDEGLEDFVQDVFLHAWKGMGQVRDPASLQAWLAKVSVRTARHALRARRLKAFLRLAPDPDYHRAIYEGVAPADRMALARVYQALDKVGARDRIAWTLHVLEERPLPEVARLCDCSLATVKRRIAAARARIVKELR